MEKEITEVSAATLKEVSSSDSLHYFDLEEWGNIGRRDHNLMKVFLFTLSKLPSFLTLFGPFIFDVSFLSD